VAQENRKVVYRATFADVAAGTYELIASAGSDAVAAAFVVLRAATGTYRAGEYADVLAEQAVAVLRNRTVTDPSAGTMTVYAEDNVTVLYTANLYEDALGQVAYRGRGAERRDRLA
jgi:hypothetical protein